MNTPTPITRQSLAIKRGADKSGKLLADHEGDAEMRWCVCVCYYYPDEPWSDALTMSVQSYASEEVAVWMLEETIRSYWTTTVSDGEGYEVALADRRGYADCPDDPKNSEVYYSKDGKKAWAFFSDGHGYMGEVVQI